MTAVTALATVQDVAEVRVRLREYLDKHALSAYRLARETRNVGEKMIYGVASGKRRPSLEALGEIITALEILTGKPVQIDELLEVVRDPEA